jgi:two-component system sensor histidine kinase QseC
MQSVRRHLLLGAAAAITVVFAALAALLYVSVRHWLVAEFDRGLLAQAESLKAATEFHHGSVRIDFDGEQPAQFARGAHAQYFELWDSGRPVNKSPSLGGRQLAFVAARPGRPQFEFAALPGGNAGRQIAMAFELRREPGQGQDAAAPQGAVVSSLTLVVARDTFQLYAALGHLRWLLGAACGAALVLCLILLAWIIRRGLRPVDAIAGRIARVGKGSLSDRLELSGVPLELKPIVDRLNEMLARLEAAFSRERAFTADVAHELRTPLAGLETSLEVCASRVRQPQDYQKVIGRCLGVTRQMHAMVDSLLVLARADAGTLAISCSTFRAEAWVHESWQTCADRAAQRKLHLVRTGDMSEPICADRAKLRQVLDNLFDNAVSYADEGGRVSVHLSAEDGSMLLAVANTGSRLSQEQADHACQRFWRGDAARTEAVTHCGLGLSIAKELMKLLGGTLRVTSVERGEFVVHLALPLGTPATESQPGLESASPTSPDVQPVPVSV